MSEEQVIWVQLLVSAPLRSDIIGTMRCTAPGSVVSQRGVSSSVECLLAKKKVTGSIPVRRSRYKFMMHEHCWVSQTELHELNLQNCKGEIGPEDMFVMPSRVEAGPGTVCINCYQIWGQNGQLDQDLIAFHKVMSSYDTKAQ